MIQKKVCMLGAFAVGKTSLVRQYVSGIFSEKYHTTVGVKIDKKVVEVDGQEMTLILWDLHGEDEYQKIRASYLRGSSGYLLVVDGTRPKTLEVMENLHRMAEEQLGVLPFVVVLNKADVLDQWEIKKETISTLEARGWVVIQGSAKTGEGVEEAFLALSRQMVSL
ncbi:MAG: GTP-binding protein [Nitrospirales bacterium]|nr:GTP-binding protein [Nitrospira sp.]MDR4501608.1 GTP-binding protein [Nitrospirales bacterium]